MALSGRGRFRGVTVVPQTPDGLLRAFSYDAVLTMRESSPGRITRHPTQNGGEITDDAQLTSPGFSCSGITSDTPARAFTLPGDRAINAYTLLKDIQKEIVPVTVLNSWTGEMLENMWPEVIDGERTQSSGATISISINFAKFRFADTLIIPSFVDSDVLALGSQSVQTSFD